jgi:hypothetical protein
MVKIPIIAMVVGDLIGFLLGLLFLPLVLNTQILAYWLLLGIGAIPTNFFLALYWEEHAGPEKIDIYSAFIYAGIMTGVIFSVEGIIITFLYGELVWGFIALAILGVVVVLFFLIPVQKYQYNALSLGFLADCILGVIFGILSGGGLACVALILFLSLFSTFLMVNIQLYLQKHKSQ